jgi:hypothetical protein
MCDWRDVLLLELMRCKDKLAIETSIANLKEQSLGIYLIILTVEIRVWFTTVGSLYPDLNHGRLFEGDVLVRERM